MTTVHPVFGQKVEIEEKPKFAFTNRAVEGTLETRLRDGKGKVTTIFDFHPRETHPTPVAKNVETKVFSPDPVSHNYVGTEDHRTTGSFIHDLDLRLDRVNNKDKWFVVDSMKATIVPGEDSGRKVKIEGRLDDPFVFSDTDLNAPFMFVPEGLDHSLSLSAGTRFPAMFASDAESFGAIASETAMIFRARVAPGVVSEPDDFWSSPSDFIDLYTVTITPDPSDPNGHVQVEIDFGASTPDFALEFRDMLGMPFDPEDPLEVDAVEAIIETSFFDGVLLSDLDDIFTVGFDPDDSLSSAGGFTHGASAEAILTANEVPGDCIALNVPQLVGGNPATLSGSGLPGQTIIVNYALASGGSVFGQTGQFCAESELIPPQGLGTVGSAIVDTAGNWSFTVPVPGSAAGLTVHLQAYGSGSCPNACDSAVVVRTVL